jgi:UDP-N-acetylglucosamine diphosphorylase / glucose-1-phosphate thymidylyltransferase / UDP-N-acetylgalactosamine diphosphorylase / glucosamine-1-phosphate N-acetyltransferase / galactosamine-1-phosphate N-acetyltransferase
MLPALPFWYFYRIMLDNMKALILAAGEGKRMLPLTKEVPKPMITILGKPLLQYILESLPDEVSSIFLVVGYKRQMIQDYFGDSWNGKSITYLIQNKSTGTADALALCRLHLSDNERFLLMYADDIYDKESIVHCLQHPLSLLVAEVEDPRRYGVIEIDKQGIVTDLVEKPEHPKSNLIAPGVYVLDTHIFDYKPTKSSNGEYYLTTMLSQMIKDHPVHSAEVNFWLSFAYPEDIKSAEDVLKERAQTKNHE